MMKTGYTGSYDAWAKRVDSDVVIYGHTHSWELKALKRSSTKYGRNKVVLANSGAWIDNTVPTYVDLIYDQTDSRPSTISVLEYSVGGSKILKTIANPNMPTAHSKRGIIPPSWTCNPLYYNTSDGCDCACGAWDPDCSKYPYQLLTEEDLELSDDESKQIFNCEERSYAYCDRNTTLCAYVTTPPPSWKCEPDLYSSGTDCHCGCGAIDPDCDCGLDDPISCNRFTVDDPICYNATCTYPQYETQIPSYWNCDPIHYNATDGCDCGCGGIDPDCSVDPEAVFGCDFEQAMCKEGKCMLTPKKRKY